MVDKLSFCVLLYFSLRNENIYKIQIIKKRLDII